MFSKPPHPQDLMFLNIGSILLANIESPTSLIDTSRLIEVFRGLAANVSLHYIMGRPFAVDSLLRNWCTSSIKRVVLDPSKPLWLLSITRVGIFASYLMKYKLQ